MKTFLFGIFIFIALNCSCQSISGIWQGNMSFMGQEMLAVFNIQQDGMKISAKMDFPQQLVLDYPVTKVSIKDDSLIIEITNMKVRYAGQLDQLYSEAIGTWVQSGTSIALTLKHMPDGEGFIVRRPQTPHAPYPYFEREVTFVNKSAKTYLSGTLTLPDTVGLWPCVVLVSGSGPQDRNEEIVKHKPFLLIADYLTRNGIAVLRYDDRGVGKSTGDYSSATTFDFANDAEAAVNFLSKQPNIDPSNLGMIGHSEGGTICMILASRCKKLKFVISLAGMSMPGDQLLLLQNELIYKGYGYSDDELDMQRTLNIKVYDVLKSEKDPAIARERIVALYAEAAEGLDEKSIQRLGFSSENANMMAAQGMSKWLNAFLQINPEKYLIKNRCSFLALNGAKDIQVPADENIAIIDSQLRRGKGITYTSKVFPGLNHLFQFSKSGMPSEYAMIEQTMDPAVLEFMVKWIKEQTTLVH